MNVHAELRGATQQDFGKFSKSSIIKLVQAAARVRDIADEDPDLEDFFQNQVRQLCELEVDAKACQEVVQQNFGEYMQTVDLENRVDSKISAVLEKEMEMAYQHHPLRNKCEKTATWAEWCHETNATIPDDPDDDLQLASGAQFKNMRCNVTTKSIFELDDPVEDAQGYIYEKAAIMQLITQHGGRVQNPAKRDANLFVTAAELVPCRRVQREAQRRRKEQQSQADNAEEIL